MTTQLREAEAACQESEAARRVLKGQLATAQHQNGVFQMEQLEAAAKLQQQVGLPHCTIQVTAVGFAWSGRQDPFRRSWELLGSAGCSREVVAVNVMHACMLYP